MSKAWICRLPCAWEGEECKITFGILLSHLRASLGFPGGASGKEPTCQYKRHKRDGFHPWVGKIPWRRV